MNNQPFTTPMSDIVREMAAKEGKETIEIELRMLNEEDFYGLPATRTTKKIEEITNE